MNWTVLRSKGLDFKLGIGIGMGIGIQDGSWLGTKKIAVEMVKERNSL
jgi:hypothetical protein